MDPELASRVLEIDPSRKTIGLGNDNGLLGKYVAFHNYKARISAEYDGFPDTTTEGRRPNSPYIPRFRNVFKQETDFLRGYGSSLQPGFGQERGHPCGCLEILLAAIKKEKNA